MAAVTLDASRAADPGLRGPVPARTAGPAAADRSPAMVRPGRAVRSWPLLVLAAPAAAEVWSGWVGIAQKTGFGLVSPLPGIWPSLHLDTAITLPVGVEAYAAYALCAWLASEAAVSLASRVCRTWICDARLGSLETEERHRTMFAWLRQPSTGLASRSTKCSTPCPQRRPSAPRRGVLQTLNGHRGILPGTSR